MWRLVTFSRWPSAKGAAKLNAHVNAATLWSQYGEHSLRFCLTLHSGTTQEQLIKAVPTLRSVLKCARVDVVPDVHRGDLAAVVAYRYAVPPVVDYPMHLLEASGVLPLSAYRPLPLGVNGDGAFVGVHLFNENDGGTSILLASVPSGGKSSALRALIAGLAPTATDIVVLDPTGGSEAHHWDERATAIVDHAKPSQTIEVLREIVDIIERRGKLRGLDAPLTLLHPLAVVCDELAALGSAGSTKEQNEIQALLRQAVATGRKANVAFVLATQRTTYTSMDTTLRALVDWRLGLAHPNDPAGSEAVLGSGRIHAAWLRKEDKGVGYLTNGGEPQLVRVFNLPPSKLADLPAMMPRRSFDEIRFWDEVCARELGK